VVNPLFQLGDTQVLGDLAVQAFGSRLYLPALGRFLQPDPVPGGSANAYGYTDGDPVNAHDTSGNLPDWGKWTLFGVILVASIALSAVAAPAAGAAIGAKVAGGAAITGKAAVAQVATSALVGAAIGAGSDVAIQATFTEGFEEGDFDGSQVAVSAGIAGVLSGFQAYGAVKASQKALTTVTTGQVQAVDRADDAVKITWARSIRSGSEGSVGGVDDVFDTQDGVRKVLVLSRSESLDSQKARLFNQSFTARNIRVVDLDPT
jgi:RHS repeat-associated protein